MALATQIRDAAAEGGIKDLARFPNQTFCWPVGPGRCHPLTTETRLWAFAVGGLGGELGTVGTAFWAWTWAAL